MLADWNVTVRISSNGIYRISGNWNHTGSLSAPSADPMDNYGEDLSGTVSLTSETGKEEKKENEEKREKLAPAKPKPFSRRQGRSERNKQAYLASQGVDQVPPPPPPPPAILTRKATPKPKRREIFLFDEAEPEPPPPKPPKAAYERERERRRSQFVEKTVPKPKKKAIPAARAVTLSFVEDHRGSERGLQVRIGLRVLGTYWSEGLNLDAYHGKVGSVYQRVAQALLNVFDLETQFFTSNSVFAAHCTWTLQPL